MVHVAFAFSALVQVLVWAKSPVIATTGVPLVALPVFESVRTMGGALVLLTSTEPKSDVVGVSLNMAPRPPSIPFWPPSPLVDELPPHPAAISAPAKPNAANRSN